MATIGSIIVNLVARTSLFDRKMRKSQTTVRSFGSTLKNVGATVLRFGAAAAAAGTAMAIGFAFAVREELKLIDATAKLAKITGDTTEGILRLRHAAILSGSSAATLDKSLLKLSARLGEAKMGTGEATDALEALQLSVKELVKLRPSEAFLRIADAVRKLQTQAEKSSVVKDLFGRAGQDFLVMLDEGSEGVLKLGSRLSDLAIFTLKEAEAAERFNDAMTNITATMRGMLTNVVIRMAPALAAIAENFELIEAPASTVWSVVSSIGSAMKTVLGFTLQVVDAIILAGSAATRFDELLEISVDRLIAAFTFGELGEALQETIERKEKKSFEKFQKALVPKGLFDKMNDFFAQIEDAAAEIRKGVGQDGAMLGPRAPDARELGLVSQAASIIAATLTPFERFEIQLGLLNDLFKARLISAEVANRAFEQAGEALRKHTQAMDPVLSALRNEAEALTSSLRKPAEIMFDTFSRIDELFNRGLITNETAIRAQERAESVLAASFPKLKELEKARMGTFRVIDPTFIATGAAPGMKNAQRTRVALLDQAKQQTRSLEDIRDHQGLAA
ncbi:MAG: hypothetical protein QGD93_10110 [Actinomycetota bacterium]|nr:hypothetical protein [Actinomycetota bacterium]